MSKTLNERNLTSNQKFMVFILAMTMFGLTDLVTQIIPEFTIGFIEIRVPYFAFIAISLAILFDPMSVALGSAFGAVIFGGLLMGNFGGIGEIEGFLQLSMAIFVGGMIVSNPLDKKQIFLASCFTVGIDKFVGGGIGEIEGFLQLSMAIFVGGMIVSNPLDKKQIFLASCFTVGIDKFVGGAVDIIKVLIGLAELEPVEGLVESVFVIQGVEFLNDFVLAGIIFGAIPAMYLVPKLYGKIEPLLGMKPRTEKPEIDWSKVLNFKFILAGIVLSALSAGAAFLDEMDLNLVDFEFEFENLLGGNYIYVAIAIAAVTLFVIINYYIKKAKKSPNPPLTSNKEGIV